MNDPPTARLCEKSRIPPTAVADISGPAYRGAHPRVPVFILFLANARKREEQKNNGEAAALSCRLDLKYPPTAPWVGFRSFHTVSAWVGFRSFHTVSAWVGFRTFRTVSAVGGISDLSPTHCRDGIQD